MSKVPPDYDDVLRCLATPATSPPLPNRGQGGGAHFGDDENNEGSKFSATFDLKLKSDDFWGKEDAPNKTTESDPSSQMFTGLLLGT